MADIHIIEWVSSWIIFYWRISHLLSHNSGMAFIACFLQQKSTTIWWLQFSMLCIPLYRPLFLPYLTRWAGTQGSNLTDFKFFVKDVNERTSLRYPRLYKLGQESKLFNLGTFGWVLVRGIVISLFFFFMTYLTMNEMEQERLRYMTHNSWLTPSIKMMW